MISSVLSLFIFIDYLIYLMISWFYTLIYDASIVKILSQDKIAEFTTRIYAFIGVIVLFFVAYKIITYIVSPDLGADKKEGLGKVTTRIFVAILLTVLIPIGFSFGYKLQLAIFQENIIGRIVYGSSVDISRSSTNGAWRKTVEGKAAQKAAAKVDKLSGNFAQEGAELVEDLITGYKTEKKSEGEIFAKMLWSGFFIARDDKVFTQEELRLFIMSDRMTLFKMPSLILPAGSTLPVIGDIIAFSQMDKILYMYFIATLAGGYALYILFMMFFDIIMRMIKLMFLELLTPFFAAGYILKPEVLKTWWSQVSSVYMLLFVRIFIFQLTMFLIAFIFQNIGLVSAGTAKANVSNLLFLSAKTGSAPDIGGLSSLIISLTLVLGLLYFAKIAPEWIGSAFGAKDLGKSDAKGFFKWAGDTTKVAVGAVVGVGAAVATGGTSLAATGAAFKGATGAGAKMAALGKGAGRTLAGGWKAGQTGYKERNFGKGMSAGVEGATEYKTPFKRGADAIGAIAHSRSEMGTIDQRLKDRDKIAEKLKEAVLAGLVPALKDSIDLIPDMIKAGMSGNKVLEDMDVTPDMYKSADAIAVYVNSNEYTKNKETIEDNRTTLNEQKIKQENTVNRYQKQVNDMETKRDEAVLRGDTALEASLQEDLKHFQSELEDARKKLDKTKGESKEWDKAYVAHGGKIEKE